MSRTKTRQSGILLLCFLYTSLAAAEEDTPVRDDKSVKLAYEEGGLAGLGLVMGGKLGGGFGQPFNELNSAFVAEFELGYNLPFLERSLGLFIGTQYSAPSAEQTGLTDVYGPGSGGSSRVPGEYSYSLTQQQVILTLGAIYRIPIKVPMFRPYAALGARYYAMRTTIEGRVLDGEEKLPLGTNEESAGAVGLYGALGGELYLGPGAVLLEVQTGQASTDQFILRDTNVSSLNVALGYRIFL